ncbi:TPA: Asp-tRNA(Asn)/Glu-tRNA(Gln) amidotransferase GatCAB subunit C [Candidatus Uhrbacteria bacterium]|nr:Asp-tRNA(Asn)/Glu-tRNA(Gln) amidotransferase GatCAB subunit C [Candidatus Uhrbacteria bacterium]
MIIDIDHVAKLAHLQLSADEKTKLAEQMPAILEYVSRLQEVDTSAISTKDYFTEAFNVLRADDIVIIDQVEHDALITAFPVSAAGALQVPGVFE